MPTLLNKEQLVNELDKFDTSNAEDLNASGYAYLIYLESEGSGADYSIEDINYSLSQLSYSDYLYVEENTNQKLAAQRVSSRVGNRPCPQQGE